MNDEAPLGKALPYKDLVALISPRAAPEKVTDGDVDLYEFGYDSAETIVPAPTAANLGDALADLIQTYDDETKPCPARRQHLGEKPCPKCRATAREGCGLDASASHKFIMNVRALSALYREGKPA